MSKSPLVVAKARTKYVEVCKSCHGEQGQGGIGPNLTDDFAIHGGAPMDIYKTINEGVPAKGMEAWGEKMPPEDVRMLAAFVITLRGTNPPNPKAPQGDPIGE